MSDDDDITAGHPTTRHLRAAEPIPESVVSGPAAGSFPADAHLSTDAVAYGPDVPDERTFRILGNVEGRRVLELGTGRGHTAVTLAKQGAKVITVDPSRQRLDEARALADSEEVRFEMHESDLAELPMVRADTVDLVVSIYALATVDDLDRVFRQVHRVLRPECHLVFSIPHPAANIVEPGATDARRITRSYFDRSPRGWSTPDASGAEHPRTVGDIFTSLTRANFRVDTLLEPEAGTDGVHSRFWTDTSSWLPPTLIVRARKEGI